MGLLDNKVCVVTGAGGGMGSEISRLFASEGALVIGIERTKGSVDEWKDGFEFAESVIPYCVDIVSEQEVKNLFADIKKNYKRVDVLVNAAGVEVNERVGFIKYENMEKMFGTNVYGTVEMLQYAARIMMRQQSGSIINISSVVGVNGNPGQIIYSATKGAVNSLTKSAAKELAQFNIRVNAIAPGMTNTKMIKNTSPEFLAKRLERISLGRIAEPSDIANAVLFLASDKSEYITGQIIGVDGGTIM